MPTLLRRPTPLLQASRSRSLLPLCIAVLMLATITVFAVSRGASQDNKDQDAANVERNAIVQFASLLYREVGSAAVVTVQASDLDKVNLIRPQQGGDRYWIELFYRGGDYVLQNVDRLVFLRRDAGVQQVKVPVNLVRGDRLGFPFVN